MIVAVSVVYRRLIPVRDDIEVVGAKMTKHAEECGQHLQAQNTVSSYNSHLFSGNFPLFGDFNNVLVQVIATSFIRGFAV